MSVLNYFFICTFLYGFYTINIYIIRTRVTFKPAIPFTIDVSTCIHSVAPTVKNGQYKISVFALKHRTKQIVSIVIIWGKTVWDIDIAIAVLIFYSYTVCFAAAGFRYTPDPIDTFFCCINALCI